MVARAMMKNPRVIYKSSHLTEHQAEEAAGIFMAFCEAVLTTPEEK